MRALYKARCSISYDGTFCHWQVTYRNHAGYEASPTAIADGAKGKKTGAPAEAAERSRGRGGKACVDEKVCRSEETSCVVNVYSRQLGAGKAPVERSQLQVDVTAVGTVRSLV